MVQACFCTCVVLLGAFCTTLEGADKRVVYTQNVRILPHIPTQLPPGIENLSEEAKRSLAIVDNVLRKVGSPNIVLVPGKEFEVAVQSTEPAYGRGPQNYSDTIKHRDVWLFVHLGTASSDAFAIKGIVIEKQTIRVTYVDGPGTNVDVDPSLAWIQVGKLDVGRYQLELAHGSDNKPRLIRFVEIQEPKERK